MGIARVWPHTRRRRDAFVLTTAIVAACLFLQSAAWACTGSGSSTQGTPQGTPPGGSPAGEIVGGAIGAAALTLYNFLFNDGNGVGQGRSCNRAVIIDDEEIPIQSLSNGTIPEVTGFIPENASQGAGQLCFAQEVDPSSSTTTTVITIMGQPQNCSTFVGGLYKDWAAGVPAGCERHHIPSRYSYFFDSAGRKHQCGPVVLMSRLDHQATGSWGGGPTPDQFRATEANLMMTGQFDAAMQVGINDLRLKFGLKYEVAIQQALTARNTRMNACNSGSGAPLTQTTSTTVAVTTTIVTTTTTPATTTTTMGGGRGSGTGGGT